MKIYQVNVVCGKGSTGKIVTDLAEIIEKRGGSNRIAYGRDCAPMHIDSIKISNKLSFYFHALMTRLTDRHGLYSRKSTKCLIKDIQNYNPDIIHLHNIHGYYVNYKLLFGFLKKYGKPIVWTLHDCWAFTGHCAYFDYVKCEKWKDGCKRCPQKKKYPNSILIDNSKANYELKRKTYASGLNMTLVTVSEWLKAITKESFLGVYPIEKISNGISLEIMHPTESFLKQQYGLEKYKIVLGVAAVWDERKGLNTFLELAVNLTEQYKIVLIGLDKLQIAKAPENIIVLPRTSNAEELAKWYTVADIYVNASAEETMGLTTVEAMACGTPVVVMNATASPELVTKECGKIVEPGNIKDLLNAIYTTKKDEKTSENCIRHAKKFEKEKQFEKYLELYKKIIMDTE